MYPSGIRTSAISILFIFLGLVSRDLNAHHQVVSLHTPPQKIRTFSAMVTDYFYAEPTLTIRKLDKPGAI